MGAPKRNRKKYDKPKDMWNLQRINSDNALIDEYGLKNMRELWRVQTEVSRLRRNVRMLLSGGEAQSDRIRSSLVGRLSRYGMASREAALDNLLDLNENAFLSRRLQTVVFRKGLAKSALQARQLITHGFISINGKKVNRPGYLVTVEEEKHIGYYRPIDIGAKPAREEPAKNGAATEAGSGAGDGEVAQS